VLADLAVILSSPSLFVVSFHHTQFPCANFHACRIELASTFDEGEEIVLLQWSGWEGMQMGAVHLNFLLVHPSVSRSVGIQFDAFAVQSDY